VTVDRALTAVAVAAGVVLLIVVLVFFSGRWK
jgi:hypothetical protein